jgi:ATP-dependent helicase/DNAse subunit B
VPTEKIRLRGKIDRIDVWGDMAAVFDYKSGKAVFSEKRFEDGLDLQLITYANVLNEMGYNVAGFYYVPIISAKDGGKNKIIMQGLTLKDDAVICALDSGFHSGKSERFKISLTKEGGRKRENIDGGKESEPVFHKGSRIKTREELAVMLGAAKDKILSAVKEIKDGKISLQPYDESVCNYCPYINICGYGDIVSREDTP